MCNLRYFDFENFPEKAPFDNLACLNVVAAWNTKSRQYYLPKHQDDFMSCLGNRQDQRN